MEGGGRHRRGAGTPASIIVLDSPGGKLEALDFSNENGRALEQAGVLTAFHTDDGITDSRFFLRSAGFGVRAGMSRERALEAMTIAGARMLGVEDARGLAGARQGRGLHRPFRRSR